MWVKIIIVVALVWLVVVSNAPELKPNARGVAGAPPSTLTAEPVPKLPTLTLAVSPCYFHIHAGEAIHGWPEFDGRRNQEPEKIEMKVGFGVSISLSGIHQIKLLSPDVEGVVRTKEGKIVENEGAAPFISRDGWNQPNARAESYTQVIDSYIVPMPAAAETVIGPRIYKVDGVRLETKGVALRHVPCGKFEACCVSSEYFRAEKEGFVKVAFLRNPPDAPIWEPNGPRASIDVLLDGKSVTITTGGVGATSGESHNSAFSIFSPKGPGKLLVKAQYGTESCTFDLGSIAK